MFVTVIVVAVFAARRFCRSRTLLAVPESEMTLLLSAQTGGNVSIVCAGFSFVFARVCTTRSVSGPLCAGAERQC